MFARSIFLLCFLTTGLTVRASHLSTKSIDLDCPDYFQIKQDFALRAFHILGDKQCLGIILNSDFGVFDFYNSQRDKCWINRLDSLYDMDEQFLANVKIEYNHFFNPSPPVEIFSAKKELLAVLQAEGDGKCFVFRDGENKKPLAMALWSWVPTGASCLSWFDYHVQNWEVMLVDRNRMQERGIPNIFLIWALMKHSQQHFPDPNKINYQKTLPDPS